MATSAENMPLEGQAENLSTTANVDVEVEYSPQKEEQLPSKEVKSSPAKKGSGGANVDKRNLVSCKVFLPDGETVSLDVDRKIKGTDLVERIHTDADIYERDFFSIYFIANNQKIFIDVHKPIKDQVPPEMKNDWRLRYGVKFYVSDPSILKEDRSRYNFCLQMCQDIKDNRVLVDRETSFRLTGLLLQGSQVKTLLILMTAICSNLAC
jgi:erythrocyte membrane protein band 4.1